MIDFQIDVPKELELVLKKGRLEGAVARKIATKIRQRFRRAKGAKGALPAAKDKGAKKPLRRTGQILKSIKAKRSRRGGGYVVFPQGTRPGETGKDGKPKRNGAVMAIQIATRPEVDAADPMGLDAAIRAEADKAASKELARQVRRAEAKVEQKGIQSLGNTKRRRRRRR